MKIIYEPDIERRVGWGGGGVGVRVRNNLRSRRSKFSNIYFQVCENLKNWSNKFQKSPFSENCFDPFSLLRVTKKYF